MGRPERPLPDRAGPLGELAAALRVLRRAAGNPGYRQLAAETHYSAATLARAASGHALPSQEVTLAYAAACGGDVGEWKRRWLQAASALEHRHLLAATAPARPAATAASQDGVPRPAQLPADVTGFTGRAAQLAELDELMHRRRGRHGAVAAILGTAGVGKTALAVHWAHTVAGRFGDGQLYVDLRGHAGGAPPVDPAEALGRMLRALDVAPERVPRDIDESAALYRSLVTGRSLLIVLDNAASAGQVRPLLPGSPGCLVLITSRDRLGGLAVTHGVHRLALDVLCPGEAQELLAGLTGAGRIREERAAAAELAQLCGFLPLALRIAAANLADCPAQPVAELVARLRGGDRLATLQVPGDQQAGVRPAFGSSYARLTPAAQRVFRLLGLAPGPGIPAAAAASLAGLAPGEAQLALAELASANLVCVQSAGRFALHDLLRLYAREVSAAVDSTADQRAAADRLVGYYLHSAGAGARLLEPARTDVALAPAGAGVTPERPGSRGAALAWFAAEHPALLAVIALAAQAGLDQPAWQIAWALAPFFGWRGHWRDLAAAHETALAAAQRLADPTALAHAHLNIGRARVHLGTPDDALAHLGRALGFFRQLADEQGQARCRIGLSGALEATGRYRAALRHARLGLDLCRTAGHHDGEADALNAIGWCHAHLGDCRQALAYCGLALRLHRQLGNRHGLAATLDSLGYAHHHLGSYPRAISRYRRALELRRDLGDRYRQAATLSRLGDSYYAAGRPGAARGAWQQAGTLLGDLGHPGAEQEQAKIARLAAGPAGG
jgi:tetratricopeptide (TPR) repeat protein